MGDKSGIEWLRDTDGRDGATWNPIAAYDLETNKRGWFCVHKDELCLNCYAAGMNVFRGTGYDYVAQNLDKHRFEVVRDPSSQSDINWPLRATQPRRIFPCSMTDLFASWHPDEWIDEMFAVMILANWHTFIVATKEEERMARYLNDPEREACLMNAVAKVLERNAAMFQTGPPACAAMRLLHQVDEWLPIPHILMGVSVGNQKTADRRREALRSVALRGWSTWISYEPALAPVDWTGWEFIRWLASGGESGTHGRPSHPDCHRGARDWCAQNGIAYFFKQWGRYYPVGRIGDKCPSGTMLLDEDEGAFQVTLEGKILQGDATGRWPPIPPGTTEMIIISNKGNKKHNGKKAEPMLDGKHHRGFPDLRALSAHEVM